MDEPIVISETCQEFLGIRYYKCGAYYQANGQRLHRVVWKAFNGSIPRRAHIHHDDLNKDHNWSGNLVCVEPAKHLEFHGRLRAGDSAAKMEMHARPSATQWHKSKAGRAWHKEQYERHCAKALHRKIARTCEHCGKSFKGTVAKNLFCSNACKSAARRASRADDELRICIQCAKPFKANRYTKIATCSRACGWITVAQKRTGVPRGKSSRNL